MYERDGRTGRVGRSGLRRSSQSEVESMKSQSTGSVPFGMGGGGGPKDSVKNGARDLR